MFVCECVYAYKAFSFSNNHKCILSVYIFQKKEEKKERIKGIKEEKQWKNNENEEKIQRYNLKDKVGNKKK